MRTIADFEDFVVLHAQDAPSVALQHALREGIIRFMRESQIFHDTAEIKGQCGVADYPIETPACRQVVTVEDVRPADGCGAGGPTFSMGSAWRWRRDGMHAVIDFGGPLSDRSVFEVTYAWAISRDDCEIPEEIYQRHMEAVKGAALAELFVMPKQEWTDPRMGLHWERVYEVELAKAKNSRWLNYSRGTMKIQSTPFLSGC